MLSDEEIAEQYAKRKDWWDFARAVERATIERCAMRIEQYDIKATSAWAEGYKQALADVAAGFRAMLEEKP